ncbi:MAG: hypothetical protein B7Y02_02425 [Rhodobacterales bacterium 17-64-5]|nr:MAG: hypothetical protein B7Y02_02425 [Rhodobacterales bacterium 17-64-5]
MWPAPFAVLTYRHSPGAHLTTGKLADRWARCDRVPACPPAYPRLALTIAFASNELGRPSSFARADLRLAPASPGKAERLTPLLRHPGATLYANLDEARTLASSHATTAAEAAEALLARGARRVLVTHGGNPCAEGRAGAGVITATPPQVLVNRVTGAGDTFMAAHILAERQGADRKAALDAALIAAADYVSKEVGS